MDNETTAIGQKSEGNARRKKASVDLFDARAAMSFCPVFFAADADCNL